MLKKKKIGIVTLYDNDNYGNRLQNYATYHYLTKMGYNVETIIIDYDIKSRLKRIVRESFVSNLLYGFTSSKLNHKRIYRFSKFTNKYIPSKYYLNKKNLDKKYDYFCIGSDQVWNPSFNLDLELMCLNFTNKTKKICMSPSFGVSKLENDKISLYEKYLSKFNNFSVREDSGKDIIKNIIPTAKVEVLIDPTMLLNSNEWDKLAKKPAQLNFERYILNYFIGNLSDSRKKEIKKIAKENNCKIINILDKNDPFYTCDPSEFLYLEKHAFLICTDSFHSSVFSILFNRPFVVFDREDKLVKMNSRIDTLLNKFNLKNRRFEGSITNDNLNHDYQEAYRLLEKERSKYLKFLNISMGKKNEN
ncbi:MAG: polysaccharide pyruvyl transferase family protein [[Clostridium] spiroforme]|uniref:polysaccharide pyruvyl transferase family protein n=1 Tax=Thomasclavelia spiroformis TaxID=29348 RepID=UPI001DE706B5|nr:polysaccharide pyruvyl transferase family protein [Thomasclavelia spiroformis]MBS7216931.1 polysaccharide pyruvyl transferase family protein [Thomasclavelia spiroformis]